MSWPFVKIGEVADVLPGFAFKSTELGDEGTPVVKIGNIQDDGGVELSTCQRLPQNHYLKKHEKFRLSNGDIIIAMTGATAGKVGRIKAGEDQVFLLNQRVARFVPRGIDPDFLWFAIGNEKYRTKFYSLGGGAAQPNMSGPQIASVEIPCPDRPTQERIASMLSAYDNLIENNRRRIALLEQAARLLYREWFVHFRFPGHETATFPDGLPEAWKTIKVEDAVKRHPPGKLYSQKTVSASGAVPVLDQGQSGIIGYHNDEPSFQATADDPVIVFSNHTCYQRIIHFPFSAIQNVLPFKPSQEVPNEIYWLHHATEGLVTLNAYKGHWPEFMAKEFVVPTEALAQSFTRQVRPMHLQVDKLRQENQKLAKARDLLLPRLMDGRISVEV